MRLQAKAFEIRKTSPFYGACFSIWSPLDMLKTD